MTNGLIRRVKVPCVNRGRGWSDAAASRGMPRIAGHHQKLGEGGEGLYPKSQREEHSPAGPLISDV